MKLQHILAAADDSEAGRQAVRCAIDLAGRTHARTSLATVDAGDLDVLAIGYHRGGLPGIIEAGSTARHLTHAASCAVLTIPL